MTYEYYPLQNTLPFLHLEVGQQRLCFEGLVPVLHDSGVFHVEMWRHMIQFLRPSAMNTSNIGRNISGICANDWHLIFRCHADSHCHEQKSSIFSCEDCFNRCIRV